MPDKLPSDKHESQEESPDSSFFSEEPAYKTEAMCFRGDLMATVQAMGSLTAKHGLELIEQEVHLDHGVILVSYPVQ